MLGAAAGVADAVAENIMSLSCALGKPDNHKDITDTGLHYSATHFIVSSPLLKIPGH